MRINQFYTEIMNLKEAEEFKRVIKRWHILSENMRTKPMNAPIILPDMLWVAQSGVGKTNLLKLMAEYLSSQNNLMEFYGDVKFFEFLLNYCSPNDYFSELQRLIDRRRKSLSILHSQRRKESGSKQRTERKI